VHRLCHWLAAIVSSDVFGASHRRGALTIEGYNLEAELYIGLMV